MRLLSFLLFFFSLLSPLSAQTDSTRFSSLLIGQWQQHLPWQRSAYVTQSPSKIYYGSEWAVVEIDKEDRSPEFITKVEGLSDAGINLIRYNESTKALIISYTNANLDLYYPADGSVYNLPFIKINPNIIGDKKIYDIFFDENIAYFACGFGMLKFDLERAEAAYTVFTNNVSVR